MHRNLLYIAVSVLFVAPALSAQSIQPATNGTVPASQPASAVARFSNPHRGLAVPPFSRLAIGGGISAMGVNLQAAVNANRYLNIRGVGNFFRYTDQNISTNGFNASGTINLATASASLDYFPFPNHGLRLSPGALFYNQNGINASMVADGGTSFTLDDYTYYSSQANPVTGTASLGLHKQRVAPTLSLGWGNIIPRNGHHFSFPVEVGAAYIGEPQLAMALVSGQVCSDTAGTQNCQDVVGNSSVNSNLQAEITKDQNKLNRLRFYPVFSFGVAYSFRFRDVE